MDKNLSSLSALPLTNQSLYSALKELEIIDQKILDESFQESEKLQTSLAEILFKRDLISDEDLGRIIGDLIKVPYVNLSEVSIPTQLIHLIPEEYAEKNKLIAFEENDTEIKVAFVNPFNNSLIQKFIAQKAQKKVVLYFATERELEKSSKVYKQNLQKSYDALLQEQVTLIGNTSNVDAPIEVIVDTLIEYAYDNGASDIHLEPEKERSVVRFRIDGILHEVLNLTSEIHERVISRIKFLSKLRTDEHLSAQDGKIQTKIENEDLDIRVSIVPIINGEKCVLRLLSARYRQFGLSDLGMNEIDLQKVTAASAKPFGMILSTGPTGSGKTTSMYSMSSTPFRAHRM